MTIWHIKEIQTNKLFEIEIYNIVIPTNINKLIKFNHFFNIIYNLEFTNVVYLYTSSKSYQLSIGVVIQFFKFTN